MARSHVGLHCLLQYGDALLIELHPVAPAGGGKAVAHRGLGVEVSEGVPDLVDERDHRRDETGIQPVGVLVQLLEYPPAQDLFAPDGGEALRYCSQLIYQFTETIGRLALALCRFQDGGNSLLCQLCQPGGSAIAEKLACRHGPVLQLDECAQVNYWLDLCLGLPIAVSDADHLGPLQLLGVVGEHEEEHRQVAEAVGDVDVEPVALANPVVDGAEDGPDRLLVSLLRDLDRLHGEGKTHLTERRLETGVVLDLVGVVYVDRLCLPIGDPDRGGEEDVCGIGRAPLATLPEEVERCLLYEACLGAGEVALPVTAGFVVAGPQYGDEYLT